jgi:hypothetical protein
MGFIDVTRLQHFLPRAEMVPVETWIALKKTDGTIQQLYDYWILGREAESGGPRWSVVQNVLGWVD